MIDIINRQRRRKINAKKWHDFTARALELISKNEPAVTIVFVGDPAIRNLNRQFRNRNYATDVLSFPARAEMFETGDQSNLGEVIVSVERAAVQAKENGLTLANELQQLILHGLLHLAGYDHETDTGQMNRLELKLRKRLGI